jgi:hypothetical protein
VEQAHRHRLARARAQVEIEHLRPYLAGRRRERREQRRTLAGHDIAELERAGDFGEVLVEPGGERRIEIDDIARGIDGEEAGRRMVEIVDRVLQFLEDVFLPLPFARHIVDRPDREPRLAPRMAERADPEAQPAAALSGRVGDPHLLVQTAALARGLEQPVDRFRHVRIADEYPLDRANVVLVRRADEVEIGGIGVEDAPALVGDQNAFAAVVDQGLEHWMTGVATGDAQDAGGHREQRDEADGAEHGQQCEQIGSGIISGIDKTDRGADQQQRDQHHQPDRAGARHALALVESRPPPLLARVR